MFAGIDKWNHWRDDRDAELILDFGYDKDICHKALAETLEIEGDYNEETMHDVFTNLPEDKPALTLAQRQLLEKYIEARPALQVTFDAWWECRYGIGKEKRERQVC